MSSDVSFPHDNERRGGDVAATRWWLRRRSEGYLYWHVYKTDAARRKWARLYLDQDDALWMNEDGSSDGLSFLRDEEMVTSV